MEGEQDGATNRDEQIARVVWAAQILACLTNKNNLIDLQPDTLEEVANDGDPPDDLDSEMNAMLAGPRQSISFKALDCIAQLLSPSKGWDYVTATGLREEEDSVEIHVARNDCFGGDCKEDVPFTSLCIMLEQHLSTATHASPAASLTDLERLAIEYGRARVDHWANQLRAILDSTAGRLEWKRRKWPGGQLAVKFWVILLELLFREGSKSSETREMTVRQAYQCSASPEVHQLLREAFEEKVGSQLWRALSFLARPVTDCRLLHSIAVRQPQFRSIRISPVDRSLPTTIRPEYQIGIWDAWNRLMLTPPPASIKQKVDRFRMKFKKDCSKPYSLHAETQLAMHYELQPELKPSLNYFGCSRKACFLCQGFLQSLGEPIKTRGEHGICYPAWGVPCSTSSEAIAVLGRLERIIMSRIQAFLPRSAGRPKVRYAPPVAQSSVASELSESTLDDLRRRQATLRLAKDQENAHREQRLILEGHAMVPRVEDPPTSNFEPHDTCVMCNNASAKQCGRCKSCYYCSKSCQQSDWPSHKLLCKAFATQAPESTPNHRRAIFFPAETITPEMIWLPCEPKRLSDDMGGDTIPFEEPNTYPYLGHDRPIEGTMRIEVNPVRERNLGCGFAGWAPRKEGYCINLIHRDAFSIDGSALNSSILASAAPSGQVHHEFRGPMIALRETPFETYESITLADFRHIIDYLISYGTTEVRENNDEPGVHSYSTIRGARICCYGEIRLHGSQPHVSVDIPRAAHRIRTGSGDISPISQRLGMPIRLWKCPDIETWLDPPGWSDNLCAFSNQDAAFLMMSLDSKDWGWAPPYWQNEIGNVLAVRVDGKDLALDDFAAMCYFVRKRLQPMIEDAIGAGLVTRTRKSVMEFITWENVEKCRGEMLDEIGSNPGGLDND